MKHKQSSVEHSFYDSLCLEIEQANLAGFVTRGQKHSRRTIHRAHRFFKIKYCCTASVVAIGRHSRKLLATLQLIVLPLA